MRGGRGTSYNNKDYINIVRSSLQQGHVICGEAHLEGWIDKIDKREREKKEGRKLHNNTAGDGDTRVIESNITLDTRWVEKKKKKKNE